MKILIEVVKKFYRKIITKAANLVAVGEAIELEYGIPIINKRISVTPIGIVAAASKADAKDCVKFAKVLDKAAKKWGLTLSVGIPL